MRTPLCAATLVLLAGSPAFAQALGGGTVLQRDLRVGGDNNFSRPDFAAEVRMRNAVVTGNVGAGRSLHVRRPYRDSSDFQGTLSSDSLYTFRRDSINSASGFRGTQGLQYQYSFTTGNSRRDPSDFYVQRSAAGDPVTPATYNSPEIGATRARDFGAPHSRDRAEDAPLVADLGVSSAASQLGTLRSTSSFAATRGLSPSVVGQGYTQQGGSTSVTASSLLGLRTRSALRERERLNDRTKAQLEALEARRGAANPESAMPAVAVDSAAVPAFRTAYQDLRDRLTQLGGGAKRTGPETELTDGTPESADRPGWENRVETLKKQIEEKRRLQREPQDVTPEKPEKPDQRALTPEEREKQEQRSRALAGLDDETLRMIRDAGGKVDSYTQGAPGSLFGEHMRAGQEFMNSGRYFDAEERFARALSMRPGDVTVMAARLHAQFGAGLYVSAAVNLRTMFEAHPEIIGVRWVGPTMPNKARISTLTAELRANLTKADKPGLSVPEESATLLAYLGFQTENSPLIREGLGYLKKARPGDPLIEVLDRVWLNPPAAAPEPTTPK